MKLDDEIARLLQRHDDERRRMDERHKAEVALLRAVAASIPPPPIVTDLMRPRAVSEMIGAALPTLDQWRREGRGPAYVKLGTGRGARVVYHRIDVEAWLASSRRGG